MLTARAPTTVSVVSRPLVAGTFSTLSFRRSDTKDVCVRVRVLKVAHREPSATSLCFAQCYAITHRSDSWVERVHGLSTVQCGTTSATPYESPG
eukprot:7623996-Alexandrium_andersonii.AAC.1